MDSHRQTLGPVDSCRDFQVYVILLQSSVLSCFLTLGRGLKSGDNFQLLYDLADKMNAAGKLRNAINQMSSTYTYGMPTRLNLHSLKCIF